MKIDHIHFYVENATHSKDWFCQNMGLQSLKTIFKNETQTEVLGNENLLFLVSSPLSLSSPVSHYLKVHPPGIIDIAFRITDFDLMVAKIIKLGIQIVTRKESKTGQLESITIQGWGDYYHTLMRSQTQQKKQLKVDLHILGIDHLVLNVEKGQLTSAVKWYQQLFDFQVNQIFNIQTSQSGLYSQALIDPTGNIRFNINEPSTGNSQIQTFLDHNGGAGIQHIGLSTSSIFEIVTQLKANGLKFLKIPTHYYAALKERSQKTRNFSLNDQQWQALESLEILLDWTDEKPDALLLQIFTQPIFKQPTFFFELIERRQQKQGFGEGNFLALFQAMETMLSTT